MSNAYRVAQHAVADLKSAVYEILSKPSDKGLRNADIGRALGIYTGHIGHEGHIPRTILSIMEEEGVVEQDKETKFWKLKKYY